MITHIENYVKGAMASYCNPDLKIAHDFPHVDRVRQWAVRLAQVEGGFEREVVEATALLHDVGLPFVQDRRDHARVGAEISATYLQEQGFFAPATNRAIVEAIACHSSLSGGGALGALLRDADMMDLFGTVGISRALTSKYMKPMYEQTAVKGITWGYNSQQFTERFQSGIGVGQTIVDQLNFQISCYDNLTTTTAKQWAKPLVAVVQNFVQQLESEVGTGHEPLNL